MKSIFLILAASCALSGSVFAASDVSASSSVSASANVCVVLIAGANGYALNTQRSCDGAPQQIIERQRNVFLEEVSLQLNALYEKGLHLINCQLNNVVDHVEYVCVVAR
jgi:hypothetical protein